MDSELLEWFKSDSSVLKRVSKVLEPLPVAAAVFSHTGHFLYSNSQFRQLFECGEAEIRAQRFVDLAETHDTYKALGASEQLFHVIETMDIAWGARTRPGQPFAAVAHLFRVVGPNGDRYGVALVGRDDDSGRSRRQINLQKHLVDVQLRLNAVRGPSGHSGADLVRNLLEKMVSQATEEMNLTEKRRSTVDLVSLEYLQTLGRVAEMRDSETGGHMSRIGLVSYLIGREIGLSEGDRFALAAYAPLHDIGKIGIPDSILHAPRKLTSDEWTTMQTHTLLGEQIFAGYQSMGYAATIAASHHERFDGSGYPHRAYRSQIPLPARITAVADVYDAIRSKRPYKPPMPHEQAIAELRSGQGSHFDPDIVQIFLRIAEQISHGYDESPRFQTTVDSIEDMDVRSLFLMTLE